MTGNRIREIRKNAAMTQEDLADKIGISRKSLSLIENGKTSLINENVPKIAEATGSDIWSVLGYRPSPPSVKEINEIRKSFEIELSILNERIRSLETLVRSKDETIRLLSEIKDFQSKQINKLLRLIPADKEND